MRWIIAIATTVVAAAAVSAVPASASSSAIFTTGYTPGTDGQINSHYHRMMPRAAPKGNTASGSSGTPGKAAPNAASGAPPSEKKKYGLSDGDYYPRFEIKGEEVTVKIPSGSGGNKGEKRG